MFGLMILGALIAFEAFNYSTTEFALTDLLGDLRFAGIRWSTILALAFCGMDFAGVARLFTPSKDSDHLIEVWYLLAAWFLAATMNAMLTWWAVSLALLGHRGLGNELLGRESLLSGVPIFVSVLVWLIRVLIIGTLSLNGDRLFASRRTRPSRRVEQYQSTATARRSRTPDQRPIQPAPKPASRRDQGSHQPTPRSARAPTNH
jgi:hypothetical protein